MSEKDGATLFKEIGEDPTLDALMQRDPRDFQPGDYAALARQLRRERAFNIQKGEEPDAED